MPRSPGTPRLFLRPSRCSDPYPDKRPTQRVGIVPDVEVKPTIEGIRTGRDEVLEEAVRQILGRETPAEQVRKIANPR